MDHLVLGITIASLIVAVLGLHAIFALRRERRLRRLLLDAVLGDALVKSVFGRLDHPERRSEIIDALERTGTAERVIAVANVLWREVTRKRVCHVFGAHGDGRDYLRLYTGMLQAFGEQPELRQAMQEAFLHHARQAIDRLTGRPRGHLRMISRSRPVKDHVADLIGTAAHEYEYDTDCANLLAQCIVMHQQLKLNWSQVRTLILSLSGLKPERAVAVRTVVDAILAHCIETHPTDQEAVDAASDLAAGVIGAGRFIRAALGSVDGHDLYERVCLSQDATDLPGVRTQLDQLKGVLRPLKRRWDRSYRRPKERRDSERVELDPAKEAQLVLASGAAPVRVKVLDVARWGLTCMWDESEMVSIDCPLTGQVCPGVFSQLARGQDIHVPGAKIVFGENEVPIVRIGPRENGELGLFLGKLPEYVQDDGSMLWESYLIPQTLKPVA